MSFRRELDRNEFNELLSWLDPNPEEAARKYETIRAGLVKILLYSTGAEAEVLADEVIDRVASKVRGMRDSYTGDPARYFYGVAKHVAHEHKRKAQKLTPLIDELHTIPAAEPPDELAEQCLERCMQKLSPDDQALIRCYYEADTAERKRLAQSLGITILNSRVKVFRKMLRLKDCVNRCIEMGIPLK
jgi:DNA-directed RNA polymerase specialized sigma24 family protein